MHPKDFQCVLYYLTGSTHITRLCVSIHSLRRVWAGNVNVFLDGNIPTWLKKYLEFYKVDIRFLNEYINPFPLLRKTQLWKSTKFKQNLYLDCDTVVINDVCELFQYLDQEPFLVTKFCNWKTWLSPYRQRIAEWQKVFDKRIIETGIAYGHAINTGVVGWCHGSHLLKFWEIICQKGIKEGCNSIFLDEIACQLILPYQKHYLAAATWNSSVKYGPFEDNNIIHYHGNKHNQNFPLCEIWLKMYNELLEVHPWCDKYLRA